MASWRQTATIALEKTLEMAKAWTVEEKPGATAADRTWKCNACPFVSKGVTKARDHVKETTGPFAHMCLEVPLDPKSKARPSRRVHLHSSGARSVVMKRRK